jgi:hypothetical protein
MAAKEKKEKSSIPGVFDVIGSINDGPRGKNMLEDCKADNSEEMVNPIDKAYVPFIVNRNFSNFQDTALAANAMNQYSQYLPNKMQYDFLRNIIRPRKRFSKWGKAADNSKDIKMLMQLYSYSSEKAQQAVQSLSEDQLQILRKRTDHGGK